MALSPPEEPKWETLGEDDLLAKVFDVLTNDMGKNEKYGEFHQAVLKYKQSLKEGEEASVEGFLKENSKDVEDFCNVIQEIFDEHHQFQIAELYGED